MSEAILDLIMTRTSIRSFLPDKIPTASLNAILKAGIAAPTAGNAQPWHFCVVREPRLKTRLAESASRQNFLAHAPLVIVVCADLRLAQSSYGDRGVSLYCIQDTAAAIQNMLLAAHALGLGACWVGAFSEERVGDLLDLPTYRRPVALIPMGFADESPRKPSRRTVAEVCAEID